MAGHPSTAGLAINLAAAYGRVMLFGLYPEATISPLSLLRSGLQVWGDVAVTPKWYKRAVRWVEYKKVTAEPMVTRRFGLDQAKEAFEAFHTGAPQRYCLRCSSALKERPSSPCRSRTGREGPAVILRSMEKKPMRMISEKSTLRGDVLIPTSKSHTIRAVTIAGLAHGKSIIRHPLESGDGLAAARAAGMFGARIDLGGSWAVEGVGGVSACAR